MSDFSGMRSRVRLRGTMLVAWFADATPPVLWRWSTNDVSAGFGLRNQENRVELLKHEPGVGSSVVAVFANEDRAAVALERLSKVLLEQKPSRASGYAPRSGFPRWLGVLCAVLLALIFLGWLIVRLLTSYFNNNLAGLASAPSLPPQAQQVRQQPNFGGTIIPGLPGVIPSAPAPAPAAPPLGTPVDVDSLYRK